MAQPDDDARRLNSEVGLVGLRAQATAVGLLQLCSELLRAGVIDDDAIGRIKDAIADQIVVSYKAPRGRDAFAASIHRRLDRLFPASGEQGPADRVGTSQDLRAGLDLSDEDAG
jgi:hypothetical protein